MKYLEIFLLCALSSLAGYTICVWQPKPHIVQVIDQGKPGKAERKPLDLSKWSTCEAAEKADWNGYACVDGKPVRMDGVSGTGIPIPIIDARDPLIVALGQAIAREEGWWNDHGQFVDGPRGRHNPGNLVFVEQPGATRDESCCWSDGTKMHNSDYAVFPSDDAGWAALYTDLRAKWSSASVVNACSQYDLFDGGEGYHNLMRCKVHAIAYSWSTGDPEKYAADIVADLKSKGLLK